MVEASTPDAPASARHYRGPVRMRREDRAWVDEARVAALQIVDGCQGRTGKLIFWSKRALPVAHCNTRSLHGGKDAARGVLGNMDVGVDEPGMDDPSAGIEDLAGI